MKESKWITIEETTFGDKKTKTFFILSKENRDVLGSIKWYGAWRKYSFFPADNTLFESQCMMDIVEFMNSLMEERKELKKKKNVITI